MSVLLPKPATMQQGELLLGKDVLNKKQLCVKYGCKFDVPILHGLKLCTLVCLQLIPLSLSHESYQFIDLKKYDNFRKVSYFSTTHQFILGSAILCWVESPVHCVHTATLPHVSVFRTQCCNPSPHLPLIHQLQFLLYPVRISRSYTLFLFYQTTVLPLLCSPSPTLGCNHFPTRLEPFLFLFYSATVLLYILLLYIFCTHHCFRIHS